MTLLLTAALAVALATLEDNPAPRWPRGRGGGERPACEAHTPLLEEEATVTIACMCGWAQVLEGEDLYGPTSVTAKLFRTEFRLPYVPFFLGVIIYEY